MRIEKIRAYYRKRLNSEKKEHYAMLGWESPEQQRKRFVALSENVDLDGKSLLDLGCGLGDLICHLEAEGIRVDYTGVDILPEMVERAKQALPRCRFICADVFESELFGTESFDLVYASGLFNLNLGNNKAFFEKALTRLCELARHFVVFNLLHIRSQNPEPEYFYYHPAEVVRDIENMPFRLKKIEIIEDYAENDFTVICKK